MDRSLAEQLGHWLADLMGEKLVARTDRWMVESWVHWLDHRYQLAFCYSQLRKIRCLDLQHRWMPPSRQSKKVINSLYLILLLIQYLIKNTLQ
jgi:hypothetical protein